MSLLESRIPFKSLRKKAKSQRLPAGGRTWPVLWLEEEVGVSPPASGRLMGVVAFELLRSQRAEIGESKEDAGEQRKGRFRAPWRQGMQTSLARI